MPDFSAHLTQLFTEVSFPDRFAAAASAGFKACEFRTPFDYSADEIASWLRGSRLENVLFNMPAGDWAAGERGIAALPGREAEFRDGVHRSLDYAERLGTRMLHAMAGRMDDAIEEAKHHETFVANLRYAASEAAKHGVTVTIEPINTRDIPGYLLATQGQAHWILEAVGAPNLKMQMDFYHMQIMEGDLVTKLRKYLPDVAHIQIAGVPGRHEPDAGEINYPYVFALLDELGYVGHVGCEYQPRGRTEDGLAWMRSNFRGHA